MAGTSKSLALIQRFWSDIERINAIVAAELTERDPDAWDIQLTTRRVLRKEYHEMIARIVEYTLALLDLPSMSGSSSADFSRSNGLLPAGLRFYLRSYLAVLTKQKRHLTWDEYRVRSDELLMENLNAAWLGLYFLGVPFIHPWEKVRRLADYRGGFPSGGCTAKYIGDVYRLARHRMLQPDPPSGCAWMRFFKPKPKADPAPILVLTHTPLVLLKDVLTYKDASYATPDAGHELGRHYALLQMLLYIRRNYPIHFFVPLDALAQGLDLLAEASTHQNKQWARAMIRADIAPWLRGTIFPDGPRPDQAVHLLTLPSDASGMPTCILGPEIGIYTLESGDNGLHFAGNEIREALLESYRDKLKRLLKLSVTVRDIPPSATPPRVFDLLGLDKDRLDPVLAQLLP